jgi:hypothetical protein
MPKTAEERVTDAAFIMYKQLCPTQQKAFQRVGRPKQSTCVDRILFGMRKDGDLDLFFDGLWVDVTPTRLITDQIMHEWNHFYTTHLQPAVQQQPRRSAQFIPHCYPQEPSKEEKAPFHLGDTLGGYRYVIHIPTALGRWVSLSEFHCKPLAEAYFDADPCFYPG